MVTASLGELGRAAVVAQAALTTRAAMRRGERVGTVRNYALVVVAAVGVFGVFGVAACAAPPSRGVVTGGPPATARPRVTPTRPPAECAAERARTAAWSLADTTGLQRPGMRRLVVLSREAMAARWDGPATIHLRVSPTGTVIRDSIWVSGVSDPMLERELRMTAAQYEFWPAVLDGCAVSARTTIRVGAPFRRGAGG